MRYFIIFISLIFSISTFGQEGLDVTQLKLSYCDVSIPHSPWLLNADGKGESSIMSELVEDKTMRKKALYSISLLKYQHLPPTIDTNNIISWLRVDMKMRMSKKSEITDNILNDTIYYAQGVKRTMSGERIRNRFFIKLYKVKGGVIMQKMEYEDGVKIDYKLVKRLFNSLVIKD
jgi:hypothetical protein